jgi:hypothetical protein
LKTFRYDVSGRWLKGNTHIHSTASDGGKTFSEIAKLYSAAGYDFLFRTDHWAVSDCAADVEDYPLLWLDGIEIDGQDSTGASFHTVCLGKISGIRKEEGYESALASARRQGAILIAAHPFWMGNSFEDCLRWDFDGVEIYNHVCRWLNGKSCGLAHWNEMLKKNPEVLAFAADDAHLSENHPGYNGGWIMVNAKGCSPNGIMESIRAGNFYSSCGPVIENISFEGGVLHLKTSPVQFARLAGPGSCGARLGSFSGERMTEISFEIPGDWEYAYAELEDERGLRAWTNGLFVGGASQVINMSYSDKKYGA